jgi:tRNA (cytidine/uridine-2'-O-)-methyltransferase
MSEPRLHVVLIQPEIAPNTGNIGRTCVAAQAKLWLVRPLGFRLDETRLKRAGLDYWPHLVWEVVDHWDQLRQRLPHARYWFFSKTARQCYFDVQYQPDDVLVFGSETQGLPSSLLKQYAGQVVGMPMDPAARSLNLASAAAIGIYEVLRQVPQLRPGRGTAENAVFAE